MKLLTVEETSSCDSDKLVQNFNSIIHEVCDLILKKSKSPKPLLKNKQAKSQKKNDYFNESLIKLRKQLDQKEALFRKYSKGPYIRVSFFRALKFFRKARKKRYKGYREQIFSSLDSLYDKNPKVIWSQLEEFKRQC